MCFFPPHKLFFFFLLTGLCCVYFSKANYNHIIKKKKKKGSKSIERSASWRKTAACFCSSKCHGITDIVWSQTVKLCLLWQGAMQSFWKGVYKCLPSATLPSLFDFERTGKGKKKNPAFFFFFFFWQHVSRVTLNLWRFPILSDHSLFGSC